MTLADRCAALGYGAYVRPDGKWKIEGQAPMTLAEASAWATMREGEKAAMAAKREPRNAVMWVERGPGDRPMVFWSDCSPAEIGDLLKAITEDAIWQMGP